MLTSLEYLTSKSTCVSMATTQSTRNKPVANLTLNHPLLVDVSIT